MDRLLFPVPFGGETAAPVSKSHLHRLLFAAALSDNPVRLCVRGAECDDIASTVRALNALGAEITPNGAYLTVSPLVCTARETPIELALSESGSTLRFILPLLGVLGVSARLTGAERLMSRPLEPLLSELTRHGMAFSRDEKTSLSVSGVLRVDTPFELPGNVSSQFITALLLALSRTGGEIRLIAPLESAPYVTMTLDVLRLFGAQVQPTEKGWLLEPASLHAPETRIFAEGDWSAAAFWLCAGAILPDRQSSVTVSGLNPSSAQGDRIIAEHLRRLGADVRQDGSRVTVSPRTLKAADFDLTQTPDLAPALAVTLACAEGIGSLSGIHRLRTKESDRVESIRALLTALGVKTELAGDMLKITGKAFFNGGEVFACGDHRIAMAAALASLRCKDALLLHGSETVGKSYPDFWADFTRLTRAE